MHAGRWNGLYLQWYSPLLLKYMMKGWSCERLALVVSAFSWTVACIVVPRLGWTVDEDAVVKLGLNLQSNK